MENWKIFYLPAKHASRSPELLTALKSVAEVSHATSSAEDNEDMIEELNNWCSTQENNRAAIVVLAADTSVYGNTPGHGSTVKVGRGIYETLENFWLPGPDQFDVYVARLTNSRWSFGKVKQIAPYTRSDKNWTDRFGYLVFDNKAPTFGFDILFCDAARPTMTMSETAKAIFGGPEPESITKEYQPESTPSLNLGAGASYLKGDTKL